MDSSTAVPGFEFHSTSSVAVTPHRETTHATVSGGYFSDPMESVAGDASRRHDAASPSGVKHSALAMVTIPASSMTLLYGVGHSARFRRDAFFSGDG